MTIVDRYKFMGALENKGYASIGELAKSLGIHRNTIQYYLSGKGALSRSLDAIFSALSLKAAEILVEKKEPGFLKMETIAPVSDALHAEFPDVTFILFGSRVSARARKYSDWDIGVYSRKGLDHARYRKIVLRKNELEEELPYFIDVVNLNRADASFLRDISKDWIFLTGYWQDWLGLQKRALTQ